MDIEIITKIEGIIFKIEVDEDLKKRCRKWIAEKSVFEPWSQILQSPLWAIATEEESDKTMVRFLPKYQTIYFLSDIFVLSKIARKREREVIKIIELYGKLYSKIILTKKEGEEPVPETIFLIGDSSTGLLENL